MRVINGVAFRILCSRNVTHHYDLFVIELDQYPHTINETKKPQISLNITYISRPGMNNARQIVSTSSHDKSYNV